MSTQIYIIEQIENAQSHEERYLHLVKLPFATVLTYQVHIGRVLRARHDENSLALLNAILSFLRSVGKDRRASFQAYLELIPKGADE